MGQSIASLQRLQALRVVAARSEPEAMQALENVKNLKHLSLLHCSLDALTILDSMLLNSASTLRSLVVDTEHVFLQDWEQKVSADNALSKQTYSFAALQSFSLGSASFNAASIYALQRAIDFMSLRELEIGILSRGKQLFYHHLSSLATLSQNNKTGIGLRELTLDMSTMVEGTAAQTEMTVRFLSAFDTLTSLELANYGQYSEQLLTNPGLSSPLLRAILRHKNLKSLRFTYSLFLGGSKVPYFSPASVASIVRGLPRLQELEFPPVEAEIVGTFYSPKNKSPSSILIRINRMKSELRSPAVLIWSPLTAFPIKLGHHILRQMSLVLTS
jgi:hypothetical protein